VSCLHLPWKQAHPWPAMGTLRTLQSLKDSRFQPDHFVYFTSVQGHYELTCSSIRALQAPGSLRSPLAENLGNL
jgi:hypothetical protein